MIGWLVLFALAGLAIAWPRIRLEWWMRRMRRRRRRGSWMSIEQFMALAMAVGIALTVWNI